MNSRCAALLATLCFVAAALAQGPEYDLLIRNGRIIDGAGNSWYRAELAVKGDSIVRIAPTIAGTARREIDAGGKIVAPGFIDIHTHASRGILTIPTADNYVRQGVTTIMEGPDGGSPLPLKDFLDRVAAAHPVPNFGMFVGQGSVRERVLGSVNRKATPQEMDQMRDLVRQGMLDGAFGLSTGLFYVPGIFTPTEEVIELAKVAAAMGGMHQSHMRNEAAGVLDSVRETIAIGELGGLPTQITHHKIIGVNNWGKSVETLKLVEEARARGVDATIDQYPYTASSTGLNALLPPWALEGGHGAVVRRLADAATRAKIRAIAAGNIEHDRGGGDPRNVVIANCPWDPSLAGKNLREITAQRGREVTLENAAETALEIIEKGGAQTVFHAINEEDLQRILKFPWTMIASDGEVPVFGKAAPHPRSYGTFVRVLGVYARDKKVLPLEEAVRKMTSFPARRLGLPDRGLLLAGLKADIVIFDPDTIKDKATFENPHQYAEGVLKVLVNGQVVFEDGKMTDRRPGRILYGPATQPSPR